MTVENLPSGEVGNFTISDSRGYLKHGSGTLELTQLDPGTYLLDASPTGQGRESFRPKDIRQTVLVTGGRRTQATVTYLPSFATPAPLHPGFQPRTMLVDGVERAYQLYIPPGYSPAKSWRVILFGHGSDEGGTDNQHQLQVGLGKYITDHGNVFPDVVVFPQLPFGLGDGAKGSTVGFHIYKTALDLTLAEVNADTSRLFMTGVSAGGTYTWTLAYHQPDRFAGIAPISSPIVARRMTLEDSVPFEEGPRLAIGRLSRLPIHQYYGDLDTRPNYRADPPAMSANPNYSQILVPGASHGEAWDRTYASPEFWGWVRGLHR